MLWRSFKPIDVDVRWWQSCECGQWGASGSWDGSTWWVTIIIYIAHVCVVPYWIAGMWMPQASLNLKPLKHVEIVLQGHCRDNEGAPIRSLQFDKNSSRDRVNSVLRHCVLQWLTWAKGLPRSTFALRSASCKDETSEVSWTCMKVAKDCNSCQLFIRVQSKLPGLSLTDSALNVPNEVEGLGND